MILKKEFCQILYWTNSLLRQTVVCLILYNILRWRQYLSVFERGLKWKQPNKNVYWRYSFDVSADKIYPCADWQRNIMYPPKAFPAVLMISSYFWQNIGIWWVIQNCSILTRTSATGCIWMSFCLIGNCLH